MAILPLQGWHETRRRGKCAGLLAVAGHAEPEPLVLRGRYHAGQQRRRRRLLLQCLGHGRRFPADGLRAPGRQRPVAARAAADRVRHSPGDGRRGRAQGRGDGRRFRQQPQRGLAAGVPPRREPGPAHEPAALGQPLPPGRLGRERRDLPRRNAAVVLVENALVYRALPRSAADRQDRVQGREEEDDFRREDGTPVGDRAEDARHVPGPFHGADGP